MTARSTVHNYIHRLCLHLRFYSYNIIITSVLWRQNNGGGSSSEGYSYSCRWSTNRQFYNTHRTFLWTFFIHIFDILLVLLLSTPLFNKHHRLEIIIVNKTRVGEPWSIIPPSVHGRCQLRIRALWIWIV